MMCYTLKIHLKFVELNSHCIMSKADVQVKIARRRSSYGIFGLSEALIASNRTLSSGSLTHWRTISALVLGD
ncbi:hypothetical protein T11_8899 [Trichinella zimbabwensis]|uniref:Uncharacterized protein n=1 Tax=Trichinella zimbabwensis TaxID=268475 RepID=A0A0V1HSU8_9BILA|nr:hypothetical protein T11_8899 [Trichinella zimbabwensis]